MTSKHATAQVFLTAFRALPASEQSAFLFTIINEHSLRNDIIDLAIASKRSSEKFKSLRKFAKDLKIGS